MSQKNVVVLNGKRYDALSGNLLGDAQTTKAQKQVAKATPAAAPVRVTVATHATLNPRRRQNVDGVFSNRSVTTLTKPAKLTASAPKTVAAPVAHTPHAVKNAHITAQHTKRHQPQSAITLMRSAVKKPTKSLRKKTNVQIAIKHELPTLSRYVAKKASAQNIVPERLERSQHVPRSPQVSRFNHAAGHHVPIIMAPIAVQKAPAKPVAIAAPAPHPHNKPVDIFEQAVANATNFREIPNKLHFKKKARNHIISMASGTLALLLIAGFVAYQSTPGLQLRVVGFEAGVTTGMPNFAKAGFAYQGATAAPGKIVVGFSDNGNKYQLSQQTTNWSGSDMIKQVGATDASGTPNYSTVHIGNNTVYRFDNTSATWVQNGNWYQISGAAGLTDGQIKALVSTI